LFAVQQERRDKRGMLARNDNEPVSLFRTALAGMIAMAAAMGFGRFSYTPILPGMMSGVPLSASDAGFIASANFVGYLAGAILAAYGWAAGRERFVALSALALSTLLLAAMGVTTSVPVFAAIRFLAGLASAFAMIFTSSIVLSHGAAAGNDHVQSAHFGGPGAGIALSSVMVLLVGLFYPGAGAWRADWLGGAIFSAVSLAAVWYLLPAGPARSQQSGPEPADDAGDAFVRDLRLRLCDHRHLPRCHRAHGCGRADGGVSLLVHRRADISRCTLCLEALRQAAWPRRRLCGRAGG
jgi:MFS family permease